VAGIRLRAMCYSSVTNISVIHSDSNIKVDDGEGLSE
jgi:hypothetical protein